jgi:TatD DNase family protein
LIDLHCHLDLYPNPRKIIEHCIKSNTYVLSVTTTPSAFTITKGLASNAPRIKTALGLHPQLAHERYTELELYDKLIIETKYVGEVGLDFSQGYEQFSEIQRKVFSHILRKCSFLEGRFISIHSRNASKEVLELIKTISLKNVHILHWYSGTEQDLKTAVELDCWFSINIKMLSSKKGISLIQKMPRGRILLETDGPFISYKGKVLEPNDFEMTINNLSLLWNIPYNTTSEIIKENFMNFLSKL